MEKLEAELKALEAENAAAVAKEKAHAAAVAKEKAHAAAVAKEKAHAVAVAKAYEEMRALPGADATGDDVFINSARDFAARLNDPEAEKEWNDRVERWGEALYGEGGGKRRKSVMHTPEGTEAKVSREKPNQVGAEGGAHSRGVRQASAGGSVPQAPAANPSSKKPFSRQAAREKPAAPPFVTLAEIKRAAERGDAEAQFKLGTMHAFGRGVPKNNAEAIRLYRKAAEQGNAKAQYILGKIYFFGIDVAENKKEGMEWLEKAAEQGNAKAKGFLKKIESRPSNPYEPKGSN